MAHSSASRSTARCVATRPGRKQARPRAWASCAVGHSASAAPRAAESAKQSYTIELPEGWQGQSKAGADVLFEDPQRPSTNIGVTVAPVRVQSIAQFGTPDVVASKLLAAERAKVRSHAPPG